MQPKILMGAALAGAFALGAMIVAYSSAQNNGAQVDETPSRGDDLTTTFSNTQEDEIRAIVRDYLLSNPETIIESINEYSVRQQAADANRQVDVARANLQALVDPSGGFVAGANPSQAKVVLIEFYDYHCGFCKRALPLINEVVESDPDVQVVFRELPILRTESDIAAEFSLASRDQGQFVKFHNALMTASGTLTEKRILQLAEANGLDADKLKAERDNPEIPNAISATHAIAEQMGITGTPTFIVATIDGAYVEVVQGFRADEVAAKIEDAKKIAG